MHPHLQPLLHIVQYMLTFNLQQLTISTPMHQPTLHTHTHTHRCSVDFPHTSTWHCSVTMTFKHSSNGSPFHSLHPSLPLERRSWLFCTSAPQPAPLSELRRQQEVHKLQLILRQQWPVQGSLGQALELNPQYSLQYTQHQGLMQ